MKTGDPGPTTPWETIVGVVADVKYAGLEAAPEPTLYVPYFQGYWPGFSREMFLVARSQRDPAGVAADLRNAVLALDHEMPLANLHTRPDLLAGSVAQARFRLQLLAIFAGLALVLAAIGIYGVMAYLAGRRKKEIGMRMALGASSGELVRMMVGEGLRMAAIRDCRGASRIVRVQPDYPRLAVRRTTVRSIDVLDGAGGSGCGHYSWRVTYPRAVRRR